MTKGRGKHLAKKQGYAPCSIYQVGDERLDHEGYKGNSLPKRRAFPQTAFCFSHFKCPVKRQPLTTTRTLGITIASYIQGQEESPAPGNDPE